MSVVNQENLKILLPRLGLHEIWQTLLNEYFGTPESNPAVRKQLAMLALYENAGWPLEEIGKLFNHDRGHVFRSLKSIKRRIRHRFFDPDVVSLEDFCKDDRTQGVQNEDAEFAEEFSAIQEESGR